MTAAGRRTAALVAAATAVAVTLGVVLAVGVVHPPGERTLATAPLVGLEGRVAALRGPDGDRCVVLVEPGSGRTREIACGLAADELEVVGGDLLVSAWTGGSWRVDVTSGRVAASDGGPASEPCRRADVTAHDGRMVARDAAGRAVLDVPAPHEYRVEDPCRSADGRGAVVVDGEGRLLLLDLRDGALRVAGDDVSAAVWLPTPAAP